MGAWSIWHWLIVIFLIGILWQIIRWMRPRKDDPSDIYHVRGWLALLVLGLFTGPLYTIGWLSSELVDAETKHPEALQSAQWITYKAWAWVTVFISSAASVYAGARLAMGRAQAAVTHGKVAIWVAGPIVMLVLLVILPTMIMGTTTLDGETLFNVLGPIPATALWTAYLSRSRRVRARYVVSDYGPVDVVVDRNTRY